MTLTSAPAPLPPVARCPEWCVSGPACRGDHVPDLTQWPGVRATAYPADGDHVLRPHPTWGSVDGLDPAVSLWLEGDIGKTIDLRPTEALRLASALVSAAESAISAVIR